MKGCLLAFLAFAPACFPQAMEITANAGASRLGNTLIGQLTDSDVRFNNGFRFGFRLTLNTWRFFGHETGYAYSRTAFKLVDTGEEAGTAVHTGLYNMLAYALPEGTRVRPFVAGGAHFSNYAWPGYSALSGGGETKVGLNYGAGVKFRIGEIFMLRFDARQYWNSKPFKQYLGGTGTLRQNEFTAGFGIGL